MKLENLEKTFDGELKRMPPTKARKQNPKPRLEPTPLHCWYVLAGKADMLTHRPHDVYMICVCTYRVNDRSLQMIWKSHKYLPYNLQP